MGVSAKQNLLKLNPALIRNITKIEKNKNKNKSRPITKATVKMLIARHLSKYNSSLRYTNNYGQTFPATSPRDRSFGLLPCHVKIKSESRN